MESETVGNRIRKKREEKGWTQEKLAQRAEISKGFLSDLENGKRNVSSENLLRIANELGASLEYLLRGITPTKLGDAAIEIPPELSKAAEELNLSYTDTIALLRTEQSVIAKRSGKSKKRFAVEDWKKLHEMLQNFDRNK